MVRMGRGKVHHAGKFYGDDFVGNVYQRKPEESKERLLVHFRNILPKASEKQILKLLG